ncbi:MAG: RagB/SusD family nutrient uptake outer membrane protein [Bacteroidetes bacterium]|nr:RagB/SusD family nutrient uptake outer membrane protein [Bacteroidota bacterium]
MKSNKYSIVILSTVVLAVAFYACGKNFLTKPPIGTYQQPTMATKAGVAGLLIGAYSLLDGQGGAGGSWQAAASNWVWGGVCSDDAHKGSDPGDQPDIVSLMTWSESSTNSYLEAKWQTCYDGIQRSNEVLRIMRLATDVKPEDTVEFAAEARFLRGHYHFELKKIFNMVPYVDESVTYTAGNWRVPNSDDIWPKIEADFQYAMDHLPATQTSVGRANRYAAMAFLAKAYMFEHKYAQALPWLDSLIANGVTAAGLKYGLVDKFNDNFNAATKNSKESVFSVQNSVNDGSTAANANAGDVLNFSYDASAPVSCCGFYQPSYSLANSYKTDPATGLPLPATFNNVDLKNDEGLKSSDPFTPDGTITLDPRLDWTVGRRGIPFLDWGVNPGFLYVRNQASGGPYTPVKNAPYASQIGVLTDKSSWTAGYTALNVNLIRFADVLLWAAEAEVEVGSLDQAQIYVNMVRNRAANPAGFVHTYIDPNKPQAGFTNTPAANYFIKAYPAGYFAGQGQAGARTLVRFERKLELAMEGHRFFDLVRYGTADTELNAYVAHEVASGYVLMKGATFVKGKSEYFAIPQAEIDVSTISGKRTLTQNPGY